MDDLNFNQGYQFGPYDNASKIALAFNTNEPAWPGFVTAAVSWPPPSTGWNLQQNTNSVSSVNWSNVTATIQDDGTTKTLIVNPPTGNRFYRLHKP